MDPAIAWWVKNIGPLNSIQTISLLGLVGVVLAWKLGSRVRSALAHRHWRSIAASLRQARDNQIKSLPAFTPSEMIPKDVASKIASESAVALLKRLALGQVTAEQVLKLHIAATAAAHTEYNPVTSVDYEEALKRAKKLDEILKRTGQVVGPLHGLPISIKECLAWKGKVSTSGVAQLHQNVAEFDTPVVQILKELGAVLFVQSNVPQTLLLNECSNPVFGTSLNPWNKARAPGGSSGGEAVLLATGASPLGVGTDIGGSCRIPAFYCGVFGLKPTAGRLSYLHQKGLVKGQEAIAATAGPMGRSVEDLALLCRLWFGQRMHELDLATPSIPWDDAKYTASKPLTIGYFTDDGFFPISQSLVRAIETSVKKLSAAGHKLVPFAMPASTSKAVATYTALITADSMQNFKEYLQYEDIDPALSKAFFLASLSPALKRGVSILTAGLGWPRISNLMAVAATQRTVYDLWQKHHDRKLYKQELMRAMKEAGVDVLLCPAGAFPAVPHGYGQELVTCLHPTFLWNLVEFPAVSVPVGTVTAEDLTVKRAGADMWERTANKVDQNSEGLPIGVQIVSFPYHDEVALRIAKELETALPFEEGKALRQKHLDLTYANLSVGSSAPATPAAPGGATATATASTE